MNLRKYNSLTEGQRAAVKRAAQAAAEYTRDLGAKADATVISELAKQMQVNKIDIAAFKEAAVPVWKEVGEMAGSDFAAKVVALSK